VKSIIQAPPHAFVSSPLLHFAFSYKYVPEISALETPQPMFYLQCKRPCIICI